MNRGNYAHVSFVHKKPLAYICCWFSALDGTLKTQHRLNWGYYRHISALKSLLAKILADNPQILDSVRKKVEAPVTFSKASARHHRQKRRPTACDSPVFRLQTLVTSHAESCTSVQRLARLKSGRVRLEIDSHCCVAAANFAPRSC